MARRQSTPKSGTSRSAGSALFVLALCCALPALAAKPNTPMCEKEDVATLDVPVAAFSTTITHHEISLTKLDETTAALGASDRAASRYFAPLAEAAIRDAFSDTDKAAIFIEAALPPITAPIADNDSAAEAAATEDTQEKPDSGMNARLPGISDEDLVRYKKQMFRRDI